MARLLGDLTKNSFHLSCVRSVSLVAISVSSIAATITIALLLQLRMTLATQRAATRQSRMAIEEMSKALQSVTDAETGVRGYILRNSLASQTRDNYLEPFERAKKNLPGNLARLQRLINRDRAQVKRYRKMDKAIRDRMKKLDAVLRVFEQSGMRQLPVLLDEGKREMDAFRAIQGEMESVEYRKREEAIEEYYASQARQAQLVNVLGVLTGVIFAIVVGEIWITLRREEARVVTAEKEAQAAHSDIQMLENAAEARAKTAAALAHDIKHWLQPIQFGADMIEMYAESRPQRVPKWIERIKVGVAAIDRLAKDTVLIFQADAGQLKVRREPVNLVQLITTAIGDIETSKHPISFAIVGAPEVLLLDRDLIERAVRNLLNNATKYSPNGGRIHVQLKFTEDISIFVADQGIGIPEEKRGSLFQEFHRAENVGAIPGSGLGLAVVRAAAIVHGGDVSVESKSGLKLDGIEGEFCTIFELRLKR